VAVPAVDAVIGHVMHVTELERLLDENVLPGDVARSREHNGEKNQTANQGKEPENADFRECIGASAENLRHLTLFGPTTACSGACLHG
jgi:hypothetical protein